MFSVKFIFSAAWEYNPKVALDYAAKPCEDGVGQCAQFVSTCLYQGGCTPAYNGNSPYTSCHFLQKGLQSIAECAIMKILTKSKIQQKD